MHELAIVIRSTMVDAFGHLNNAVYLELYEWARWEWWQAHGVDLWDYRQSRRRAPTILRADIRFLREIRLGDTVMVRTRLESAGRARAVFAQEMANVAGEELSSARITFVMFDVDSRKPVPIARDIIALREDGSEGS